MGPIRVTLSRYFDRNVQMVKEAKNLSAKPEPQTYLEDDSLDFRPEPASSFQINSNEAREERPTDQENQMVLFRSGDSRGFGFNKNAILRPDQKLSGNCQITPKDGPEKDIAKAKILELKVESLKGIFSVISSENVLDILNEPFKQFDIKFNDFTLSDLLRSPVITANYELMNNLSRCSCTNTRLEKLASPKFRRICETDVGKTTEDPERKPYNRIGAKLKKASSKSFWWTNKSDHLLEPGEERPGGTNCVARKFEEVEECSKFLVPKIDFEMNQDVRVKLEIDAFPEASEQAGPSSVANGNLELASNFTWASHSFPKFPEPGCSSSVAKVMDQKELLLGIPREQEGLSRNFKTEAEWSSLKVAKKLCRHQTENYPAPKEQTKTSSQNSTTENLNLQEAKWTAPLSPHALIEENFQDNPWSLLVATIFLNKTSCSLAKPYLDKFLEDHPNPEIVLSKSAEHLEPYFVKLGLPKRRAVQIWRMSRDFVHKSWKRVSELYGIGKYGEDAFRMFCLGDFSVEPSDRFLKIYKAWYLMTLKEEREKREV